MKYISSLCLFVLFLVPSFVHAETGLTLSRVLIEDMARKTLPEFTSKYLVTNQALNFQVEKALLAERSLPLMQGVDNVSSQIAQFSNFIARAVMREPQLAATGGYIPSFVKDSKMFAQQTGFEYSDMAVMLRHSLGEPVGRNFAGYFVQDFRELQLAAINPATGQTLDEALRSAYQQGVEGKGGILIITEEGPEQEITTKKRIFDRERESVPAQLKDMYVMDWANGQWISYQKSVLNPLREIQQKALPDGAIIDVEDTQITVAYATTREKDDFSVPITVKWIVRDFLFVHRSSPWYEQLKYAKEKGYYVQVQKIPGATREEGNPLSNIRFLFARKKGDPFFDNVFELERGL